MSDSALDQSEIERLLGGGGKAVPPPAAPAPAAPASDGGILSQDELNALFNGGGAASPPAAVPAPPAAPPKEDAGGMISQDELESLFGSGAPPIPKPVPPPFAAPPQAAVPPSFSAPPGFSPPSAPAPSGDFGSAGNASAFTGLDEEDEAGVPGGDIDYIMKRADETIHSIASTPLSLPTEVIEFQFPEFGGTVPSTEHATLDQISEVDLDVKIELGRTYMYLEDILKLRRGSVVPLDKIAGDTVDIYVNGRLLARGEVLVMNENFCVRVAELLAGAIPME
ncbi:MAG: flagellar motor switch protein FliN [Planctomycetaceae bacterium]|jgi:flagellar motor switch protein FliN/FliY|nr:flagellar motor switch protein FliN [Planctomycetaceae bacterium]